MVLEGPAQLLRLNTGGQDFGRAGFVEVEFGEGPGRAFIDGESIKHRRRFRIEIIAGRRAKCRQSVFQTVGFRACFSGHWSFAPTGRGVHRIRRKRR